MTIYVKYSMIFSTLKVVGLGGANLSISLVKAYILDQEEQGSNHHPTFEPKKSCKVGWLGYPMGLIEVFDSWIGNIRLLK